MATTLRRNEGMPLMRRPFTKENEFRSFTNYRPLCALDEERDLYPIKLNFNYFCLLIIFYSSLSFSVYSVSFFSFSTNSNGIDSRDVPSPVPNAATDITARSIVWTIVQWLFNAPSSTIEIWTPASAYIYS